jgi:hypothetical protein
MTHIDYTHVAKLMKYITTRNNTHRLYKQHIFVCTAADEI